MSMANVTKTTRIQAIAELQKRKQKSRIGYRTDNRRILQQLASILLRRMNGKIIQKMDEYLTEVKQEQKERFENAIRKRKSSSFMRK